MVEFAPSHNRAPLHDEDQVAGLFGLNRSTVSSRGDWNNNAKAYAAWRHALFDRVCAGLDITSRFVIENPDVLQERHARESGTIIVLSHVACWLGTPFPIHQIGVPFTFLIEILDERIRERYAEIGVEPIETMEGVTLVLTDGRRIRIPSASVLQQAEAALRRGLTVGFLGDTYRPGGQREDILGQSVELINHYALVAERTGRSIVALRQWTDGEEFHLRFEPLTPDPGFAKRSDRVRSLVHNFARMLDEDLRKRPEQYAYFPNSIFGHRSKMLASE